LSTGVPSLGSGGKQLDDVPHARGCLSPRRGRGGEKKILEFFPATSQCRLISLNIVKIAPDLGVSLSSHPSAIIKIDRLVRHDPGAFTRDPLWSLDDDPVAVGGATAAFVLVDLGFLGSRLPRL
jgi:hypothetical protein